MTTNDFLKLFKSNVEADIGHGELTRVDLEHLSAIFLDTLTEAAKAYLPSSFPTSPRTP